MDYKENYLDAYKQMKEAAIARLKKYGKTLDVHKTLKQMLMKEKGYQTTKEIPEDVWDDYKWENTYSCVFEGKHEQLYCCNILKVRYNKKIDEVEVYLHDDEGYISDWFMESYVGWDKESIWMTILDFIDGEEDEDPQKIWVLFDESLYDYELQGRRIMVFTNEDEARKKFKEFADDSRKTAKENGWDIGNDNDNFFEAYPEGSWGTTHVTVELNETVINTPAWCHS